MGTHEAVYERNHANQWCLAVYPKGGIPKSSVNGSGRDRSNPFLVPEACMNEDGTPNLTMIKGNHPAPSEAL